MLFFWSLKTMSPWPLQMSDEVVHASTPKTIPSRGTYHRRVPYVTALSLAKSVLGHFMDHTAWKRFRSIFHAFSSGTRSCLHVLSWLVQRQSCIWVSLQCCVLWFYLLWRLRNACVDNGVGFPVVVTGGFQWRRPKLKLAFMRGRICPAPPLH